MDLTDHPSFTFVDETIHSKHRDWLASLPFSHQLQSTLYLCHGTPHRDDEYLLEKVSEQNVSLKTSLEITGVVSEIQSQFILCGHSHIPQTVLLDDGRVIINPGSVGLQAYTDNSPYPHFMETGSPHANYCILTLKKQGYSIEHIQVFYDWGHASKIAVANGRADWGHWLKTGRAIIAKDQL